MAVRTESSQNIDRAKANFGGTQKLTLSKKKTRLNRTYRKLDLWRFARYPAKLHVGEGRGEGPAGVLSRDWSIFDFLSFGGPSGGLLPEALQPVARHVENSRTV